MEANRKKQMEMIAKKTIENLNRNHLNAVYVQTKEEAFKLVTSMIKEGSVVASGGSVTLNECGIIDWVRTNCDYIDRYAKGLSEEEKDQVIARTSICDYYLSGANAITEHGEIYQVDGNSNRVSALAFGPKKVIMVASMNKVVPNLREAVTRVKHIASPSNCIRLTPGSYCEHKGYCIQEGFSEDHLMCEKDCGDNSICSNTLIMARQRYKERVYVVLVGENLGY